MRPAIVPPIWQSTAVAESTAVDVESNVTNDPASEPIVSVYVSNNGLAVDFELSSIIVPVWITTEGSNINEVLTYALLDTHRNTRIQAMKMYNFS